MKAPDKIIIPLSTAKMYKDEGLIYKGVEYIRKDIVFDLLKGFDNPVTKLAYREIIEKLESL